MFSGVVFALKAGLGFGGAITGYVLAYYGYVPNVEQTPGGAGRHPLHDERAPRRRIRLLRGVPASLRIDKAAEIRITDDLRERRDAQATV